ISFIAGIFYVVAWELVQAMTQMDFATAHSNAIIANERANGASAEALAKLSADMEAFKVQGLEVGHPCAWTGSWTHMRITAGCPALSGAFINRFKFARCNQTADPISEEAARCRTVWPALAAGGPALR
ncbi:MAG: hypothetical protein COS34_06735, partial [Lysobacterales bacterium CG02_land_8_20_14_3_00_62_12]